MSKYNVGLRNVWSYQVAWAPWLRGSIITGNVTYNTDQAGEVKLEFPFITKSITVTRTGGTATSPGDGDLRIHFANESAPGKVILGYHYVKLTGTNTITMNVKCKEIYLSIAETGGDNTTYEVYAELTQIPTGSMYILTGSGITD